MTRWLHKLDVSDVWRNDALSFEERRDGIVSRIRALPVTSFALDDIADALEDSADTAEFNSAWSDLYDWADTWRVWVDTFGRAVTR